MREIGVALLGLGNVGAGVIRLLDENASAIEARLDARVAVRGVLVRDPSKARQVDVDSSLITTDVDELLGRDDVEIVCELVGGETEALDYVLKAISRGKHVVTANKALLAVHGESIFQAAEQHGVDVYYEAAVCGGVPVIRCLREGLASDRVESFYGIVNGTSNFILSTMTDEGLPFADVLADAQTRGYAEADPTLDISGGDAAHKLAILATLAFGSRIDVSAIHTEGIDSLEAVDFAYAKSFGFVIKPLAIARDHGAHIEARVHPAMIPDRWLLADVRGANNALYVQSYALGPSMYYGAGAGMMPTAMAVVSDVIEVCRNIRSKAAGGVPMRSFERLADRPLMAIEEVRSRFYLRFQVRDEPGVLGRLTTILGEHGVSMSQVEQGAPGEGPGDVAVVVLTHTCREGDLRDALKDIAATTTLGEPAGVIRIAS